MQVTTYKMTAFMHPVCLRFQLIKELLKGIKTQRCLGLGSQSAKENRHNASL